MLARRGSATMPPFLRTRFAGDDIDESSPVLSLARFLALVGAAGTVTSSSDEEVRSMKVAAAEAGPLAGIDWGAEPLPTPAPGFCGLSPVRSTVSPVLLTDAAWKPVGMP